MAGEPPPASLKPRRRFARGCLLAVLGLLVAVLALRRPVLAAIPGHLIVEDKEEPADAIVVLAGDSGDRVRHAVALWKRGLSRTGVFVVSGGPIYDRTTWASLMAAHAEELGVPHASIVQQSTSRTTAEDALYTAGLLRERGVRSVILVTSAWHSRRAKREFVKAVPDLSFRSCPAPPPELDGDWWQDAPATRAIVTEILKYLW